MLNQLARLIRGATAFLEHPDLVRLHRRGVPPRLALSLDQPWPGSVLELGALSGEAPLPPRATIRDRLIYGLPAEHWTRRACLRLGAL